MSALAPTLQAFFTDRLIAQRNASPHTITAYRDTLRLLLDYAEGRLGHQPCQLDIAELDAPLIAGFLDHLERERQNSSRTRNLRLAAIHSLFRYAQHRHPEHAEDIARVLAIPPKRTDRPIVTLLDDKDHTVAEEYGVWGEKKFAGKRYMGVKRSTFVIDADGTVKTVMHDVKPATHADEVLAALAS